MAGAGWNKADERLPLARAYVRLQAPYFSDTLYGFVPTPYPGLTEVAGGPMAVSERMVLLYEPDWLDEISVRVLATALGHECFHVQLKHMARGKAFPDPRRANRAADLAINGIMAKQQRNLRDKSGPVVRAPIWEFPEWALMPAKYGFEDGLTQGEYYLLLEKYEKDNEKKQEETKEGAGAGPPSCAGAGQPGKIMAGCCGGIAGNPLSDLEKALNNTVGRSEADCKAIARKTAANIREHLEGAGRGSLPGNWAELIEISDTVFHVPWTTKLARATRSLMGNIQRGGMDYSMRRPSKRSTLIGFPRPGLVAYEPTVWMIVDSSASMGKGNIGDALRVCVDVMRQTGVTNVWYMEADTTVQKAPTRVSVRDLYSMEVKGRGGTDFRPAIQMAEQARPRPNAVIYLSDGDGTAPNEAPAGITFIWGIVPGSSRRAPASWGETVFLEDTA